jgi:hypothetical protein
VVELNGRLNKCGVISPRYDIGHSEVCGGIGFTWEGVGLDKASCRLRSPGQAYVMSPLRQLVS